MGLHDCVSCNQEPNTANGKGMNRHIYFGYQRVETDKFMGDGFFLKI